MSQCTDPPPSANAPPTTSARRRLMLMARPRATKANALAALLATLLGFAVATQVRQNQSLGLESLRQSELVNILDNATLLSSRLDQNARDLQATRDQLVSGSTSGAADELVAGCLEVTRVLVQPRGEQGRVVQDGHQVALAQRLQTQRLVLTDLSRHGEAQKDGQKGRQRIGLGGPRTRRQ